MGRFDPRFIYKETREISFTGPAVDTDIAQQLSGGAREHWHIKSIHLVFVTDANAANRKAGIVLSSTNSTTAPVAMWKSYATASMTASKTWRPEFVMGETDSLTAFDANNRQVLNLVDLLIPGSWWFGTNTNAMQVGDQWTYFTMAVEVYEKVR